MTTNPRTIRTYEYEGRPIGTVIDYGEGREFETDLTDSEAMEILSSMPVGDKVHIRSRAYGALILAQHFGIRTESYLTDEDLAIHVMNLGCKNLTELNHKDSRAWQLMHDRGLAKKFFKKLVDSD